MDDNDFPQTSSYKTTLARNAMCIGNKASARSCYFNKKCARDNKQLPLFQTTFTLELLPFFLFIVVVEIGSNFFMPGFCDYLRVSQLVQQNGPLAAEKQRRYRAKRDADPEQREKWLAYEKIKYMTDKTKGKRKLVKDMNNKEHQTAKKLWKKYQRDSRKQEADVKNVSTPPSSVAGSLSGSRSSPVCFRCQCSAYTQILKTPMCVLTYTG